MSFLPSGILGTHNGLGLISSMDTALCPVIAKVLVKHDCFFQVLFQPLRLFHSTAMIIVFTFKSSRSSAIQNLIYFISQWPQSICIKYFFFQLPLLCLTRHLSLTLGPAYGLRGSNWHLQSRINLIMKYPVEELKLSLQGGLPKEYQKILLKLFYHWEHANKIFFSLSKRYIDKLCRI